MTITLANGSHIGERASLLVLNKKLALVFHKISFTFLHIKWKDQKMFAYVGNVSNMKSRGEVETDRYVRLEVNGSR